MHLTLERVVRHFIEKCICRAYKYILRFLNYFSKWYFIASKNKAVRKSLVCVFFLFASCCLLKAPRCVCYPRVNSQESDLHTNLILYQLNSETVYLHGKAQRCMAKIGLS